MISQYRRTPVSSKEWLGDVISGLALQLGNSSQDILDLPARFRLLESTVMCMTRGDSGCCHRIKPEEGLGSHFSIYIPPICVWPSGPERFLGAHALDMAEIRLSHFLDMRLVWYSLLCVCLPKAIHVVIPTEKNHLQTRLSRTWMRFCPRAPDQDGPEEQRC